MRDLIGRTVTLRQTFTGRSIGWRRFVVIGIAKDGRRLRCKRLRADGVSLNRTVVLLEPEWTTLQRDAYAGS